MPVSSVLWNSALDTRIFVVDFLSFPAPQPRQSFVVAAASPASTPPGVSVLTIDLTPGMADDGISNSPSYSDIAKKLLDDHLLLTALELHYELIEAGKELPGLREFFSNPSNFEHSSPQNDNISITLSMGMGNMPQFILLFLLSIPFVQHQ